MLWWLYYSWLFLVYRYIMLSSTFNRWVFNFYIINILIYIMCTIDQIIIRLPFLFMTISCCESVSLIIWVWLIPECKTEFGFDNGFDGWIEDQMDDGDWRRNSGHTSTGQTGPSADSSGDYSGTMYFEFLPLCLLPLPVFVTF